MVSAVFHSPRVAKDAVMPAAGKPAVLTLASPPATPVSVPAASEREPFDWQGLLGRVVPPILGLALLIGIWALLTIKSTTFPSPAATFDAAVKLFADPFYSKGPNDQGIGWNILFSLERVAVSYTHLTLPTNREV